MKPESEELLHFLLWSVEFLVRPTRRSLEESFESWAWRNHLGYRLGELERRKLISRTPGPNLDRIVRLTEAGEAQALGGRIPEHEWKRSWDGRWRLVLFDVPIAQDRLRQRFRRTLRRQNFGCLQGSVWISPDPADQMEAHLRDARAEAKALIIIEGRPAAGETDEQIVASAWDFVGIQQRYEDYLRFLDGGVPTRRDLPRWTREEIAHWRSAAQADPLLPYALLPKGYLGMQAWQRRKEIFSQLAVALVPEFANPVVNNPAP